MRAGRTLVSGGAVGTDSVAVDAALSCGGAHRCIEVLPFGLDQAEPRDGVCQLSVCEPWAGFTTGQAMERNALIYALGRRALVVRPRWRRGGTWHGSVDALRRRLGALGVYGDDRAAGALVALGAKPILCTDDVSAFLEHPVSAGQPSLFGALHVRELATGYC
jgi:predicted Rossmann fold nucleotide-binding protein DprA/Smf involved in DNA uptake